MRYDALWYMLKGTVIALFTPVWLPLWALCVLVYYAVFGPVIWYRDTVRRLDQERKWRDSFVTGPPRG